ncbi:MAG: ribosome biogenesis GTPase Der, partial [Planctomycetota bacterium]|jgi:GTP-binding protein
MVDEELLKSHIEQQIQVALSSADALLFVVDGKEGLVPGDQMVAERLRRLDKPVLLVVNKVESLSDELLVHEWQRLGFGDPLPVSAIEGYGISDLCDRLLEVLPAAVEGEQEEEAGALNFAVIGKRNSGKSTLINLLAGEERVIVSEIPGTTRDSVDVLIDWHGRRMLAIDTAGVRKKSSVQDAIELFSYTRAKNSIMRADVVLHLFDVRDSISQVDKKVARFCVSNHKPVMLVGNKIDLADSVDLSKWDNYVRQQLAGLQFAPMSFISAMEGVNVDETLEVLFELRDQSSIQLNTARLNEVLQEAKTKLSPKSRGKIPKLFYGTQVGTMPLSILVFVNDPKLFRGQYERYLQNVLREAFDVPEVPIRINFRTRSREEAG